MADSNYFPAKTYRSFNIGALMSREGTVIDDYDQMEAQAVDQRYEGIPVLKIIGTLTAATVQTSESGHRVVIEGENNRIIIYNSNDEQTVLIDGSQTTTTFDTADSKIRIGGNIFIASDVDSTVDTGTLFAPFGFSNEIAQIIQVTGAVNKGAVAINSAGDSFDTCFAIYQPVAKAASLSTRVFVVADDGTVGVGNDILPVVESNGFVDLDIGSASWPFQSLYLSNALDMGGGDIVDVDDIIMKGSGSRIDMNQGDIDAVAVVGGSAGEFDFTSSVITVNEEISPTVDNVHDLGDPSSIWNDLYASDVNYDTLTLMSDARIKKNITTVPPALPLLSQLRPVLYNLKNKTLQENQPAIKKLKDRNPQRFKKIKARFLQNMEKRTSVRHAGFIAQEMQMVLPQLVNEREDGMLTIRSTELIPLLVKAVQELSEKVDVLENQ